MEGQSSVSGASGASGAASAVPERAPSPFRAGLFSALLPGAGQIYNRQLEKAILLWLWGGIVAGAGAALLVLGLLGRLVPRSWPRPPLGDWIAEHAGPAFLAWLLAALLLWGLGIRDACSSAAAIRRGEVVVRHPLRWQLAHVLGSQLLGFLPLLGFLFPPGVVAEALDAARERRRPDARRLLEEGKEALLEWMVTRAALFTLWSATILWALWWLLRALGAGG